MESCQSSAQHQPDTVLFWQAYLFRFQASKADNESHMTPTSQIRVAVRSGQALSA